MGFESGFDEKIDVIDLIINVLKDHEKKMDELVARLEEAITAEAPARAPQKSESKERVTGERKPSGGAAVIAALRSWTEFTERCASAGFVTFNVDDGLFKVSAIVGGVLYTYEEEVPDMEIRYRRVDEKAHIDSIDISSAELVPTALRGRLDCGLKLEKRGIEVELPEGGSVYRVVYVIDPVIARSWIAYQLGIEEDSIVEGELSI